MHVIPPTYNGMHVILPKSYNGMHIITLTSYNGTHVIPETYNGMHVILPTYNGMHVIPLTSYNGIHVIPPTSFNGMRVILQTYNGMHVCQRRCVGRRGHRLGCLDRLLVLVSFTRWCLKLLLFPRQVLSVWPWRSQSSLCILAWP